MFKLFPAPNGILVLSRDERTLGVCYRGKKHAAVAANAVAISCWNFKPFH